MNIIHIEFKPMADRPKEVDAYHTKRVGYEQREVKLRCNKCYEEGRSYRSIPTAVVNKDYHRKQPNFICPHGMQLTDERGYIIKHYQYMVKEEEVRAGRRELRASDVHSYFKAIRAVAKVNLACERCGLILTEERGCNLVSMDLPEGSAVMFICCTDCAIALKEGRYEAIPDLMDWIRFNVLFYTKETSESDDNTTPAH